MLTTRQKLVAEDVKVDHTFMDQCRADIKKHHCFSASKNMKEAGHDFKRAAVLICLEYNLKKGKCSCTFVSGV